jgi:hypothetical protein
MRITLASGPALGLKPVDQIDDIEESVARAVTDAGPGNGDGQMRLAGPGSADPHQVALKGDRTRLRSPFP